MVLPDSLIGTSAPELERMACEGAAALLASPADDRGAQQKPPVAKAIDDALHIATTEFRRLGDRPFASRQVDHFGDTEDAQRDQDFEDLVVSLNTVSTELQGGGYGDRLLAAVFAFEEEGRPIYFIYNFKRGAYYPFVPKGERQRDNEHELRLKAQVGAELPIEEELERWFPLWEIPL